MEKIIQIIPSDDIVGEFDIDGKIEQYPIICWALIEDDEASDDELRTFVIGMTICDEFPTLIPVDVEYPLKRYLHVGKKAEQTSYME